MKTRQTGMASLELALGSGVLLLVLLAVIELGRVLFVWNTLSEATRRGARLAAVCPVNHPAIRRVAIFNSQAMAGHSSVLANLTTDAIQVDYLDTNGAVLSNPANQYGNITHVRVSIRNYPFIPVIPFLHITTLPVPAASTLLPAESLGAMPNPDNPNTGLRQCFGT
jgi:Flp pilus assembly protein TadG